MSLTNSAFAFLVAGFFFGTLFIIFIYKMLGFDRDRERERRRRYSRERRRRRYYDDDEDYYEPEERGSGGAILLVVLLIVGGIMFLSAPVGTDFIKSLKKPDPVSRDTTASSHMMVPQKNAPRVKMIPQYAPALSPPGPSTTGTRSETTPETKKPLYQEEKSRRDMNQPLHYIRVKTLWNEEEIGPYCRNLQNQGLPACTLPKGDGTAIYVGPYRSRQMAEDVQRIAHLSGNIETY